MRLAVAILIKPEQLCPRDQFQIVNADVGLIAIAKNDDMTTRDRAIVPFPQQAVHTFPVPWCTAIVGNFPMQDTILCEAFTADRDPLATSLTRLELRCYGIPASLPPFNAFVMRPVTFFELARSAR